MSKKIIYFLLTIFYIVNIHSITIDGELNELEWQKAKSFTDFLTIFPDTLAPPKYRTEAKYFADEKGIYFAFINYQPKEKQTFQKHPRDSFYANADRNYVIIDFNNNANIGYEFTVTLGDSIRDAIFVDENDFSDQWDAIWYAKTKSYDDYWISEFLIPWDVAPMINVEGPYRDISVSLARWAFSENEVYNSPGLSFYKSPFLSKFKKLQVKNLNMQKTRIDFFPYASFTNNFIQDNRQVNIGGEIFWDINQNSKYFRKKEVQLDYS